MSNPLLILQTLDRHLDHPIELTLYGRAALALGPKCWISPAPFTTGSEIFAGVTPAYHQVHRAIVDYYRSLVPKITRYFLAPFSIKSGGEHPRSYLWLQQP